MSNKIPIKLPDEADRLGAYGGFDLHSLTVSEARFSDRMMAYVYATEQGSTSVSFVKVTSALRDLARGLGEREIERRLVVDVISRSKLRIEDGAFERGRIYTIELGANQLHSEM